MSAPIDWGLAERVAVKVSGRERYSTSEGVQVTVSLPALSALTLSGGSSGQVSGMTGSELEVNMSGGSALSATGSVGTITLSADGKSFTAEVSLEFRDPDDHLLVALPAHFDGKRISLRDDEADQAAGRD